MASKEVKAGAAYVELFVTDNKLSQGLRSASKRITQWADRTQKQLKSIGTSMMSGGMLGLGLTGAVGGGLFALTKSFSDTGDQLADMTQRTGMSAEYLSEFGHAARLCGTDIGLVEKSVHKMQMHMLDASQGTQKSIDVLNDLGLSYQQLATLSPEQQFDAIIDRLGQMDEANRAAHAMEVFGRSAHQLMPLINAGTKEIAAMRNEARQLGISMSGPDAEAAAALDDAITKLQNSFRGLVNHIGAALAPALTDLVDVVVRNISAIVQFVDRNSALIVSFAKWTAIVAGVSAGVVALGAVFWGLGAIAGAVLGIISTALSIVAGLVTFLVSPIGIATAAIAGLLWYFGTLGDTLEWLKDVWASFFSTASRAWKGINDAIAAGRMDLAMKVAWTAIKLVWTDGVQFLYKQWLWFYEQFMTVWDEAQEFAIDMMNGIKAAWVILSKSIRDTWADCMQTFLNSWDSASTKVAKGLAWIYAKLQGLDAAEMVRIVEEDHAARQNIRGNEFDAAQNERDTRFNEDMAAVGQENFDARSVIGAKQDARQAAYDQELAQMNADRKKAEQDFNAAVAAAGYARATFSKDKAVQRRAAQATEEADETAGQTIEIAKAAPASPTSKSSASGTFNATAIQSLQSSSPMSAIAKNTEQTAKYVKKQYEKKDKAAVAG